MSKPVPGGTDRDDDVMTEYVFTCAECGQEIDVNGEMRRAILSNGCPVCSASADEGAFEE